MALHRFKKLLKSQERIGDNAGISRTLREIATIYDQQDELVSAIRYGERALTSAKDVYDQQQMVQVIICLVFSISMLSCQVKPLQR